ncbi:hypothetical protein [Paenibacillus eucommiae]|uniref:Uncharacterized protein n=1 Tax=Paenibacillus eucommiae TaxID=1355755 RepID=A0ABS4IZZ4_9BACL|nr:hypothetical protein [Paenibacillus eucommiae]MBP1992099.1 hypothetical protein [Paenibacillus eucommiae]
MNDIIINVTPPPAIPIVVAPPGSGGGGGSSSVLLGSYTLTPTKWDSTAITVDTTVKTLTIAGHGLIVGDQVIFTYQKARGQSSIPTGLMQVKYTFVRLVSGDSFKVAETNTDTTVTLVQEDAAACI